MSPIPRTLDSGADFAYKAEHSGICEHVHIRRHELLEVGIQMIRHGAFWVTAGSDEARKRSQNCATFSNGLRIVSVTVQTLL